MINTPEEEMRTEGEVVPEIETTGLAHSKEITMTTSTKTELAPGVEMIIG